MGTSRSAPRTGASAAPAGTAPSNRRLREAAWDALYRDETGRSATCRDCGVRFAPKPWYRVRTVGHSVPLSRVRPNETWELVKYDQCMGCNREQGTRTPEEWRADQASGALEPVRGLTGEQKRLRARITWDRAKTRRRRRRRLTETIALTEVPDHLRSHAENAKLARERAKGVVDGHERRRAKLAVALASAEHSLEHFRSLPTHRRRLFGLVRQVDEARLRLIADADKKAADLRRALQREDESVLEAQADLDYIRSRGGARGCPCPDCAGDFEERDREWREERREESRRAFRARLAPRPCYGRPRW